MARMAFIPLCHISGRCQNIILKAVAESEQTAVIGIFCRNAVTKADIRNPELSRSRNLHHSAVYNRCRKEQGCVLTVHIKTLLNLIQGHLRKALIKKLHLFGIHTVCRCV